MKKQYIAVIDSGIGGISALTELDKTLSGENFLYLGDNDNAPYGTRTKDDLLGITVNNIEYLKGLGELKAIVLGCNTLSVGLLDKIRYYCEPIPVFGVFPPVETAALSGKKSLLLATPLTAEKYTCEKKRGVSVIGLPRLAKTIEEHAFGLESVAADGEIDEAMFLAGLEKDNRAGAFENIILGCTHYSFIKNKISDHFKPKRILNGVEYTAKTAAAVLKTKKSSVNNCRNSVLFVGKNSELNRLFYEKVVKRQEKFK